MFKYYRKVVASGLAAGKGLSDASLNPPGDSDVLMKGVIGNEEDLEVDKTGPFPARLLIKKAFTPNLSVKKGVLKAGSVVKEHLHEDVDQFEIYPSGRAIFYVEGVGEKEIKAGSFSYSPKGKKHAVRRVLEDLEIITVFVPAFF